MRRPRRLLPDRPRRALAEPVVPMINIVFLMLVFVLMTARIAPQPPFAVTPPDGAGDASHSRAELFVAADGRLAFAGLSGESALTEAARTEGRLTVTADRALTATALTGVLSRLSAAGKSEIDLTLAVPR